MQKNIVEKTSEVSLHIFKAGRDPSVVALWSLRSLKGADSRAEGKSTAHIGTRVVSSGSSVPTKTIDMFLQFYRVTPCHTLCTLVLSVA